MYHSGGTSQNFSSPIYLVACSLNATNYTVTLDPSGVQLNPGVQPTDVAWSAFSPTDDLNLTSGVSLCILDKDNHEITECRQISSAMTSANSLPLSPYCQPIMSYPPLWANITAFNAYVVSHLTLYFTFTNSCPRYMRSLLGMGMSTCSGTSLAQYTSNPPLLTKDRVESAVSQTAAEFLWLGSARKHSIYGVSHQSHTAGELGSVGGGFDRQTEEAPVLPSMVQQWKLNVRQIVDAVVVLELMGYFFTPQINLLPVSWRSFVDSHLIFIGYLCPLCVGHPTCSGGLCPLETPRSRDV